MGALAERFQSRKVRVRTAIVALLVIGAGVLLVVVQPWATTSYDINDSGVWIAKSGQVGRANAQTADIELALAKKGDPNVVQDGSNVYLLTRGESVTQLDSADPGGPDPVVVKVEEADGLAAGGGVVAAASKQGEVWVIGKGGELGDSAGSEIMRLGTGGKIAVGPDGTVAGYSPSKGVVFKLAPGQAKADRTEMAKISGDFDIAVVGTSTAVLDKEAKRLYVNGDETDLKGLKGSIALQRSGPAVDGVLVADAEDVVSVRGGDRSNVVSGGSDGAPARPVAGERCTYAAWNGKNDAGQAVVRCAGTTSEPVALEKGRQFVWRSGGGATALNDPASGKAFVESDGRLVDVGAWPEPDVNKDKELEVQPLVPEPTGNRVPVAVADDERTKESVGARPGIVTYLNILRNDYDEDGDAIFVANIRKVPKGVSIAKAQGGRSVAIDLVRWKLDDGAKFSFEYQISDGDPGHLSEWKPVDVKVVPRNENTAPELIKNQSLIFDVEAGKTIDYEVLSAFWDPDGDPVYLAGAESEAADNTARSTADGWVTFEAGQRVGQAQVALVVKDTRGSEAEGASVQVDIGAPGAQIDPVLRSDFAEVRTGDQVLDPLANDVDPNAEQLTLTGAELRRNKDGSLGEITVSDNKIRISPNEPGDYVLLYTATDGKAKGDPPQSTMAVHVYEPKGDERPVALPDVVEVEVGKATTVDLLDNDADPVGDVLAVSDLALGAGQPTSAKSDVRGGVDVDFRHFRADAGGKAQITGAAPDQLPITYTYTVSASGRQTTSTVTVVVVKAVGNRPPVPLRPDVVKVRAGDAARIPISDLALDPDGDPLSLKILDQPSKGSAATGGDSLRFFAPDDASDEVITIPVSLSEPSGNSQNTTARVLVVAGEKNLPPVAPPIDARVRSGKTVSIAVPLEGADPDGDPVRVGGISSSSVLGKLEQTSASLGFTYTANEVSALVDESFEYYLVDSRGERSAPAKVRVSVLPVAEQENPPVAFNDHVTAGDDATVWVDPTANDTDLDGDVLKRVEATDYPQIGCKVKVDGRGLSITTADESCKIPYAVVDVAGQAADGKGKSDPVVAYVTVEVVKDFEGLAPVARDDFAVPGKGDTVRVAVLDNDEDPDGSPKSMKAKPAGSPKDVEVDDKTGELIVRLRDDARLVRYEVTDAQGLVSSAVVRVPSKAENRTPVLRTEKLPIKIKENTPEEINLSDYIYDPNGNEMQFKKSVLKGDLDDPDGTGSTVTYTPRSGFTGTAALNVRVTDDGSPPASVAFTIPLLVEGENKPPEWRKDPCGQVQRGRADKPVQRTLADAAFDTDGDELTFDIAGSGEKNHVAIEVSGDSLTASADDDAVTGSTVTFTLTVTDGKSKAEEHPCRFEVTKYTGPGLEGRPAERTVKQGESVRIDLKELVVPNDKGLKVLSAKASGGGRVDAPRTGSTVTFTADAKFAGEVVLQYTAVDKFTNDDPNRKVSEQIRIKVLGKPEVPSGVTARQDNDDAIHLEWKAGANNGATDKVRFFVHVNNAASGFECGNPCNVTKDHISYGKTLYTFSVSAKNEIGESDKSLPSSPPIPFDKRPEAPDLEPGSVTLPTNELTSSATWSWTAKSEGSTISAAQVSLDRGGWENVGIGSVTKVLPNREDCYRLRVRVKNARPDWSEPSNEDCVFAIGKPLVTIGTVTPYEGGNADVSFTLTQNGDPATAKVIACGGEFASADGRTARISGCDSGPDGEVVTVVANSPKGGDSDPSSTKVVFPDRPGQPASPMLEEGLGQVYVSNLSAPSKQTIDYWLVYVCTSDGGCPSTPEQVTGEGWLRAPSWSDVYVEVEACIGSNAFCSSSRGTSDPVPTYGLATGGTITSVTPMTDIMGLNVEVSFANPSGGMFGDGEFTFAVFDSDGDEAFSAGPGTNELPTHDPTVATTVTLEVCLGSYSETCQTYEYSYTPP